MATWISISEAAKVSGLSTNVIKGLVRREQIPFLRIPCKQRDSTRITKEALDEFIANNSRGDNRVSPKG
jgi:excisionase family DNA binding protein